MSFSSATRRSSGLLNGFTKSPDSSNSPRSANESVHFAYTLGEAETSRGMWRSFSPLRTGESRLTPDSPDSASILSVRSENGSLQRLNGLWAAFAPPSPFQSLLSSSRLCATAQDVMGQLEPSTASCQQRYCFPSWDLGFAIAGIFSIIFIIMDRVTVAGRIARMIRFIRPGMMIALLTASAFRPSATA